MAQPCKGAQGETHLAGATPIPNPAGLRAFWHSADSADATIWRAPSGRRDSLFSHTQGVARGCHGAAPFGAPESPFFR